MNHEPPRPALFDVVLADVRVYQTFSIAVILTSLGVLLLFASYWLPGALLLLGALLAGGATYRRVRLFQAILTHGTPASAQITLLRYPRFAQRGRYRFRIEYRYTYGNQEYQGRTLVSLMAQQMHLQAGEHVVVLVYPPAPRHALLPRIYLETTRV